MPLKAMRTPRGIDIKSNSKPEFDIDEGTQAQFPELYSLESL